MMLTNGKLLGAFQQYLRNQNMLLYSGTSQGDHFAAVLRKPELRSEDPRLLKTAGYGRKSYGRGNWLSTISSRRSVKAA